MSKVLKQLRSEANWRAKKGLHDWVEKSADALELAEARVKLLTKALNGCCVESSAFGRDAIVEVALKQCRALAKKAKGKRG